MAAGIGAVADDLSRNELVDFLPIARSPWGNTGAGARRIANGAILIADENNNRAIEVNRAHQIAWQDSQGLNIVAFVSHLPNQLQTKRAAATDCSGTSRPTGSQLTGSVDTAAAAPDTGIHIKTA